MRKILTITTFFLLLEMAHSKPLHPVPARNNCSFYPKLEKVKKCKRKGVKYLTYFGEHYCENFMTLANSPRSSDILKSWVEETSFCLQEMLYSNMHRIKSCKGLKNFAFDSHLICYKSSNFCGLRWDDMLKVIEVVSYEDVSNYLVELIGPVWELYRSCNNLTISSAENETAAAILAGLKKEKNPKKRIIYIKYLFTAPKESKSREDYFIEGYEAIYFNSKMGYSVIPPEISANHDIKSRLEEKKGIWNARAQSADTPFGRAYPTRKTSSIDLAGEQVTGHVLERIRQLTEQYSSQNGNRPK